ncbi:MAG: hypothetical protein O3A46_14935 [Candidatus Poribacteria bacterium]|nr:hypothetical protein [Candidatus Poribacteria bacterium]
MKHSTKWWVGLGLAATVVVSTGASQVIASNDQVAQTSPKPRAVPILSELPVLGSLFSDAMIAQAPAAPSPLMLPPIPTREMELAQNFVYATNDKWGPLMGVPALSSVFDAGRAIAVRSADSPRDGLNDLMLDIDVMTRVIQKRLVESDKGINQIGGIYLEGFGPLFVVRVSFPVQPPVSDGGSVTKTPDDVWTQVLREVAGGRFPTAPNASPYQAQRVDVLKTNLMNVLKQATNIRNILASERVNVLVFGSAPQTERGIADMSQPMTMLAASMPKSVVDSWSSGGAEPAADTLKPVSVDAAALGEDTAIMSRILSGMVKKHLGEEREAKSDSYELAISADSVVWGGMEPSNSNAVYLPGYGAIFSIRVDFPLAELEPLPEMDPAEAGSLWEQTRHELMNPDSAASSSGSSSYGEWSVDGVTVYQNQPNAEPDGEYDPNKMKNLKAAIVEALRYAGNMKSINPNESVVIAVRGVSVGRKINRQNDLFKVRESGVLMTFHAKKSDLTNAESLSEAEMERRITTTLSSASGSAKAVVVPVLYKTSTMTQPSGSGGSTIIRSR